MEAIGRIQRNREEYDLSLLYSFEENLAEKYTVTKYNNLLIVAWIISIYLSLKQMSKSTENRTEKIKNTSISVTIINESNKKEWNKLDFIFTS